MTFSRKGILPFYTLLISYKRGNLAWL